MNPTVVGSLGVGLLLLAYALNLAKKMAQTDLSYLGMNILGAVLAAWYAWAENNYPFVVLEAVWITVSVWQLVGVKQKGLRV